MVDGEHLFRRESGRMIAALTRIFGTARIALAEDVVQDAFCRALETWKLRGVPDNPSAWLMRAAKNRAIDVIRRERKTSALEPTVADALESEWTLLPAIEAMFAPDSVKDDQLRMMFTCCQPRLPQPVQVALILNLSCGFGVEEIAAAFLVRPETMRKRIDRGKATLARASRLFELVDRDIDARLPAVLRALYLLFNEGYHGACAEAAVQKELCHEAMRLSRLLLRHPRTAAPESYALLALMCFDAARLPARLGTDGEFMPLAAQDRSLWDRALVEEGARYLNASATGDSVSAYHAEAAIAAMHAEAADAESTDWARIVSLYDVLMRVRPSPVVALNRAIAVGQLEGPERGLEELRSVSDAERLDRYPFYEAAFGELELRCDRPEQARDHFLAALSVARNPTERRHLQRRAAACRTSAV